MTITDARLAGLTRTLLAVQTAVRQSRATVRTYGIGLGNLPLDDRHMHGETTRLTGQLALLRRQLEEIDGQLPGLSTRVHRGGSPSSFGRLGNLRGNFLIVQRELEQLEVELRQVHGEITSTLNDPLRTSSAAASDPLGNLVGVAEMVLELLAKTIKALKDGRG